MADSKRCHYLRLVSHRFRHWGSRATLAAGLSDKRSYNRSVELIRSSITAFKSHPRRRVIARESIFRDVIYRCLNTITQTASMCVHKHAHTWEYSALRRSICRDVFTRELHGVFVLLLGYNDRHRVKDLSKLRVSLKLNVFLPGQCTRES